jgi:hypothetical protein
MAFANALAAMSDAKQRQSSEDGDQEEERQGTKRSGQRQEHQSPDREVAERMECWKQSGMAREWVLEHLEGWDHSAWVAMVNRVKATPFWPLKVDEMEAYLQSIRVKLWHEREEMRKRESDRRAPEEPANAGESAPHRQEPGSAEPCWFCKRNEANGKPEKVLLHQVKHEIPTNSGSRFVYGTVQVDIPRCGSCEWRHVLIRTLAVLSPFGCLAVCCYLGYVITVTTGSTGAVAFFITLGLLSHYCLSWFVYDVTRRWHERFPEVKALVTAGWKHGNAPSSQSVGMYRGPVKWSQAEQQIVGHLIGSWEASEAAVDDEQPGTAVLHCLKAALDEAKEVDHALLAKVNPKLLVVFREQYLPSLEFLTRHFESGNIDRKALAPLAELVRWWNANREFFILPANVPNRDWFCPKCRRRLFVRARHAGRKVRCSGCQTVSTVPA